MMNQCAAPEQLIAQARNLFKEERAITRLDGWFLVQEAMAAYKLDHPDQSPVIAAAGALQQAVSILPLSVSSQAIFAGTQRDAFARSYALINPNFKVSTFNGYCDPTAVYNDIEPNAEFPAERIERVRAQIQTTPYVQALTQVYADAAADTGEVAYFIEQVTGHLIPDLRPALQRGVQPLIDQLTAKMACEAQADKVQQYMAMKMTLETVLLLANRYAAITRVQLETADEQRRAQLTLMLEDLEQAVAFGATTLHGAIQVFILLWQVMCLEQAPNPFAFSVGNTDRIFEPFRAMEGLTREEAAAQLTHLLVFFNVGDRSWAISQNVLVGGRDASGQDLTSLTSYALLDAYFAMNLPQPILSVKLHQHTPDQLYRELGRFFFTPGCLTPSLFNDDSLFPILLNRGVTEADVADYSIAGCQEPLIMGRDNGNTTNSWLNLPKILELTLNRGCSLLTGLQIGRDLTAGRPAREILGEIRSLFYQNVSEFVGRMTRAANGASIALSHLPVPFLSTFMGGMDSGIDLRNPREQGTRYNGSGCLIHGLTVVADSFAAIDALLVQRPADSERLLAALQTNFAADEPLRQFLLGAPKFGNHVTAVDQEASRIADTISALVHNQKNYLGNPFRPDWATPSTHLLYGYWVGATPDGRQARTMLNYGTDPLFGEAQHGLGLRVLSALQLPYEKFVGGYASHLGLDPAYFRAATPAEKGIEFKHKIMVPLFFSSPAEKTAPYYLYLNITTPEMLRQVLANPQKYAPSGVYIMRIHGTFVNFLDLSPEIQQDIIQRLDLKSTVC